jgi:hypothetical protein
MNDILAELQYDLKNEIIQNRGAAFKSARFTNEELNNKVLGGGVLSAKES